MLDPFVIHDHFSAVPRVVGNFAMLFRSNGLHRVFLSDLNYHGFENSVFSHHAQACIRNA